MFHAEDLTQYQNFALLLNCIFVQAVVVDVVDVVVDVVNVVVEVVDVVVLVVPVVVVPVVVVLVVPVVVVPVVVVTVVATVVGATVKPSVLTVAPVDMFKADCFSAIARVIDSVLSRKVVLALPRLNLSSSEQVATVMFANSFNIVPREARRGAPVT